MKCYMEMFLAPRKPSISANYFKAGFFKSREGEIYQDSGVPEKAPRNSDMTRKNLEGMNGLTTLGDEGLMVEPLRWQIGGDTLPRTLRHAACPSERGSSPSSGWQVTGMGRRWFFRSFYSSLAWDIWSVG